MNDQRLRELYQNAVATRTTATRAECPDADALLALARRDGSEEERLRTLDHAMSCGDCMRELELLRAIEKAGGASGASVTTRRDTVVSWRRAVPLALAASAVLAVGLVVGRDRGDQRALDDPTRGADVAITVHTPRDVDLGAGDSLVLAWQPASGAGRYVVEVLDADGRAAIADTTSDTTHVVRNLGRLAAGRDYRWWVRTPASDGAQRASALFRLRVRNP